MGFVSMAFQRTFWRAFDCILCCLCVVWVATLSIAGCAKIDSGVDSSVNSSMDSSADSYVDSALESSRHNTQSTEPIMHDTPTSQDTLTQEDMQINDNQIIITESGQTQCEAITLHKAKLSFVGDIVLGDYKGASGATFNAKFKEVGGDYDYFTKGIVSVLENDDLSIGNMEGVLSDKNLKNAFDKPFSFKGQSIFTQILKSAHIQALNIANNHSRDYGRQGFLDTIEHLQQADLAVFGEGILHIYEANGIKFGLAGHRGWNLGIKSQVKKEIKALRDQGADIVIFTFHWGEERKYYPNATQRELAHFSIDSGADMVIGHHPHVLQGIETYKGKKIIYSLGNFIYGGAKNPKDKDSMIYQTLFLEFASAKEAEQQAKEIATYLQPMQNPNQTHQANKPNNTTSNTTDTIDKTDMIHKAKKDVAESEAAESDVAKSAENERENEAESLAQEAKSKCFKEIYLQGRFITSQPRIDVFDQFVLIHNIVPVSISSTSAYNDYVPMVYEEDSSGFTRIFRRLEEYSQSLNQKR